MAAAVPVETKQDKNKNKQKETTTEKKIKPSQLPLYEEPQDLYSYEYHGKPKSKLEDGISVARKELGSLYSATADARESLTNIVQTGKAHTLATVDYVLDEENVAAKAGAITAGGLLGLVIFGRKKGFIKKIFYTSVGAGGLASLLYPKEAYKLGQELYENAGDYSVIAYNFVAGVKPQSGSQSGPASETPKKPPVITTPSEKEPSITPSGKPKDVVVKMDKAKPLAPPVLSGDIGQSNPEDKDMYTTRS